MKLTQEQYELRKSKLKFIKVARGLQFRSWRDWPNPLPLDEATYYVQLYARLLRKYDISKGRLARFIRKSILENRPDLPAYFSRAELRLITFTRWDIK